MTTNEKMVIEMLGQIISSKRKVTISLTSNLRDELGIDSIKLLNLILDVEKVLKIDITTLSEDIDFSNIETVADIVRILDSVTKQLEG